MLLRAHIFWTLNRWLAWFINAFQIIHQGFWLGMLDRKSLYYLTDRNYRTCEMYKTSSYNLTGLRLWEVTVLDRFFLDCRSVLLGAMGGGREVIALARRGIQVDAFDCSNVLVEIARQLLASENINSKLILSSPAQVPETFGIYDGIIVGWGAYMHIPGREARIEFLKQFRRHVRSGGPILLSFLSYETVSRRFRLIFAIAKFVRFVRRSSEPVELGDSLISAFQHQFTKEEIEQELKESEFRLEYFSEDGYPHAIGRAK
jgi:2-polyprenyl-3-methyl-5-hydroxy-6-metoxy-1,4-benzoquinol methylase